MPDQSLLARLPKVDLILARLEERPELEDVPGSLRLTAVRAVLDGLRRRILDGGEVDDRQCSPEAVAALGAQRAREMARPSLRRVVNGTGVVVHTNLGRSLLPESALRRLLELNRCYTNLEYDLAAGHRGSRYSHVAGICAQVAGAEAALVVNNNAAAVFLTLKTLAQGREVIVSRGQLVEIGGSFRIPEVMASSGAILREVGATNKTHLRDYENAISDATALILKVHTSNYALVGFTQEVPLAELKALAQAHGLPVMEDLGSGSFVDLSAWGLPPEPTVQQALAQGADVVTFSGDKLLGGPQAGVILGRADLIERIRKNPLNRAMRPDKLTIAALEATLELYRDPARAAREIPTLAMIGLDHQALKTRAAALARGLRRLGIPGLTVTTRDGESRVGGGALPLAAPKTRLVGLELAGVSATRLETALRANDPPIIGRLEDGRYYLDPRTLLPPDTADLGRALARVSGGRAEA